ncbi:MAG: PIG-L deacetylase family protein [Pseudomonadota bacterium]
MRLDDFRKVLMFFAHPDDETLAAGGTMARLVRGGCEVHVAIPSTGIRSRRHLLVEAEMERELEILHGDCARATGVLGIRPEHLTLGHFSDNEMDRHTLLELIHWLEALVDRVAPDALFTHHRFCTNIDHQYCHEAAVVATRPSVERRIPLICGEVPSSTGYLRPAQWEPNLYVEISRDDLELKVRAMESYKGEARPDPHPRSREVLEALAKVRGSESGHFFAESFMVQRDYA